MEIYCVSYLISWNVNQKKNKNKKSKVKKK